MTSAIVFQHVSKRFIVQHERPRSFQELVVSFFRDSEREELWALRDISFAVRRGETLGLIGHNGSGKSTALKLMSRILEPTAGHVQVEGRVSALIELGAGFHPDLTGRENTFLNGSLLGLSRSEMQQRYDEIVEFSELRRFIDVPLKHYSSGMQMRLGFAIAMCVDPDVLLIDEVLAVGDEGFQRKCLARINRFRGRDKAIVFVSHDLGAVRQLCDRVIWLENGVVMAEGPAHEVVVQYLVHVGEREEARMAAGPLQAHAASAGEEKRWGTGEAEIVDVRLRCPEPFDPSLRQGSGQAAGLRAGAAQDRLIEGRAGESRERHLFDPEDPMIVDIEYRARQFIEEAVFGIGLFRDDGTHCYGTNTGIDGHVLELEPGTGSVQVFIDRLALLPGTYTVDVAVHAPNGHPYDYWRAVCAFSVRSSVSDCGVYRPRHRWVIDGISLGERWREGTVEIWPAEAVKREA
ncbi:MAG: ABC transporter ATP-binding protein [Anaerolineae bacterium]